MNRNENGIRRFYKTINWWPGGKATDKSTFLPLATAFRDNKIILHLQLCFVLLHVLPEVNLSPAGWFHTRNVCLKHNSLQTHKKGEFLHKINIHSVLMHFMLVLFSFFLFFYFFFNGSSKCNIIGWMSKNELLFNLLQYSGSFWSCSIEMFFIRFSIFKRLMIYFQQNERHC